MADGWVWKKVESSYKEAELYKCGVEEWTLSVDSDYTNWIKMTRVDLQELHKAIGKELGI